MYFFKRRHFYLPDVEIATAIHTLRQGLRVKVTKNKLLDSTRANPANTRLYTVVIMLAHRLRRWPNSITTMGQRLVFAGNPVYSFLTLDSTLLMGSGRPDHCVTSIMVSKSSFCRSYWPSKSTTSLTPS